jgi:hypothetical protein
MLILFPLTFLFLNHEVVDEQRGVGMVVQRQRGQAQPGGPALLAPGVLFVICLSPRDDGLSSGLATAPKLQARL